MNADLYERIRFRGKPLAHPGSTIVLDNARFTLLTERMVRLEWSPNGIFEDRSTYAFPTRYSNNVPDFEVQKEDQNIIIKTPGLKIQYQWDSGTFSEHNITIEYRLNEKIQVWKPGEKDLGNLRGTRRTLDRCEGDAALEKGLLSRDGWVLFDDSRNVVFDDDGWVAPRPEYEVQDWYFFGYGHDYKTALSDYACFGGITPLIPYFILGGWWSRYWAYSEQDFRDLVAEFEDHGIPLDVFVIDMDWHTPLGWTGYTWNRELFPDPPVFLSWLHDKGLKTTLNLHPADGVHPHEEVYPEFARAMDIDPETKQPVPFQIADKDYVKHYFEMIHHPMENDGIDFWWMDWQQGEISEVKGLDPLPWINHLHFNDIKRRGVRPMLYSRWGGLGNHRYYIGFSGDTFVTWESLQFQPYMTATAANVLYGWWSHDIGGHMGGPTDPELYARWVQFGALSPILRLHSTKDPRAERRPWAYAEEFSQAAKKAFLFRYQLIPYLYTMARVASDSNITLCRPMYYEYPDFDDAYTARYQYYLGDQLIAAPFVFPRNQETKVASLDVWVPPGTWFAWDTLESFTGPRWIKMVGDIERMPLLAKTGAIIPLAPPFKVQPEPVLKSGTSSTIPRDHVELMVFPGEGSFDLYEDDGVTEAYQHGQYLWTHFTTSQPDAKTWLVSILPSEGQCDTLPPQISYTIYLKGSSKPSAISVDDRPILSWQYSEEDKTIAVKLPPQSISQTTTVQVQTEQEVVVIGEETNKLVMLKDICAILGEKCPSDPFNIQSIISLETSAKLDALARLGAPFVSAIAYSTPEEVARSLGTLIIANPVDESVYSAHIDLSLYRDGKVESTTIDFEQTNSSHIVQIPHVIQMAETLRWEAEVTFTWQNATWKTSHRSKPLFPGVNKWECISYHPTEKKKLRSNLLTSSGRERNAHLSWRSSNPILDTDTTYTRCHVVPLSTLYLDERSKAKYMSVLLTSLVSSPVECDVKIEFTTNTPVEIVLNGERVAEEEYVDNTALGRFVSGTHFTESVHLKVGVNSLVVDCPSAENERVRWFFGCVIVTTDGELITDLTYH